MKIKKQYKKIILLIIIILFTITFTFTIMISNKFNRNTTTELIQLSPQTSRQMMGYLIKTTNGKLIVIDGGTIEDSNHLIEQINKNGGKVDYWFLTHAHDDHVGAFTQIVNKTDIKINKIYVSTNELSWYEQYEPERVEFTKIFLETLENEKIKAKIVQPKLNDVINIDEMKVEILGIKNPEFTENAGNEQSMIIKFDTKKTTLLILGDAGIQSSEKLLNIQKEKLKSDIVQMSHHGQAGATKELYIQINPTICLWPTPEWLWNNDKGQGLNSGDWKTLETRQWVEELNITKNHIAKDGDITINIK